MPNGISVSFQSGLYLPHSGIRFPQNPCTTCPFLGSASTSAIGWKLGLSASRESILVCLTNLLDQASADATEAESPPRPGGSEAGSTRSWEARRENERDTRFVKLGKYLCEVRAVQYWRLEKLKSFDRCIHSKS